MVIQTYHPLVNSKVLPHLGHQHSALGCNAQQYLLGNNYVKTNFVWFKKYSRGQKFKTKVDFCVKSYLFRSIAS